MIAGGKMSATKLDLMGKRFGLLTVVEYDKSKRKWLCKCDCGNDHYVTRKNLLYNGTKSCGCNAKRLIDITGKKYNWLTAISYDAKEMKWLCRCDCGNTVLIRPWDLKNNKRKSCGCMNRTRLDDLTGQRFGKLKVLCRAPDSLSKNGFTATRWFCICDCGKTLVAYSKALKKGIRYSCPECK